MPSQALNESRPLTAFIHRGAWGDLYVSLAALHDVCERHERVVLVGSKKWKDLIQPSSWPRIKEIWVSEDGRRAARYSLHEGAWVPTGTEELKTLFKLVNTSYNLRTESLRYAWAPWKAGVPERHGSAAWPVSLLVNTHRAPWLGKDPLIHERDRLLQVVEAPDHIGERARAWSESRGLPALKKPDTANGEAIARARASTYILVNPTSSRREKAWPTPHFRRLVSQLVQMSREKNLTVRIIGAPSETEWLKEVKPDHLDESQYIIQPKTIHDLCDVLSGAKLLVTNTSSMQFLAPGYGVRTITLMGRGEPRIWGPLGPDDRVIRGTIDHSLDGKIFEQERKAYESIEFETVLEACRDALK